MSELALKRIRECKENHSTRLDLGNCGLVELPEELFKLTWLEELKLKKNKLLKNINNIGVFKELLTLDISETSIFDISEIASLSNLVILYLQNTKIYNLFPLRDLKFLVKLSLESTLINNLNALEKLFSLNYLNLNSTDVSNLNPLAELKNLRELYFSSTMVAYLNPLSNLANLEIIDASSTICSDLAPISNLSELRKINISSTQVSDISYLKQFIKKEIKIYFSDIIISNGIYVHNTPIVIPPVEILYQNNDSILRYFETINTKKSDVDIEKIKLVEERDKIIKKLDEIEDNFNKYSIEKSSELEIRNLITKIDKQDDIKFNNRIMFFRENLIERLTKKNINISSKELLSQNLENYEGSEELYEAKLIIVGEGGTGKTTLYKKLIYPKYILKPLKETHGINIHEGLPFKHRYIGDKTFHTNLWDFGGQELQYMTHQFFLTPKALYILVMDARRESPNLSYWFKIISLLGRDRDDSTEKVRLLLVFNKRGNTTGTPPPYQDQLKYYEDSLAVQYLEVDLAENDYRFDNLQNAIKQSLVTLPIVKSQLPRLWKAVREDLREEAKSDSHITIKRFSEICNKYSISNETDQWLLSGYLHQLGSLLHFQNDRGLRRLVILSPQWAVDGVYTFLSEESIARNNGRFTEDEFMALLATKGYNRDDADVILQLMTKNNFDICYEATEGNYVAAQLLPDNAPQYKWHPEVSDQSTLQFRYQYPIMPKGLMSRLIVRLSDDIERENESGEQIVWKKGVVLHIKSKEGECRVRLREDDAESKAGLRQILIDVMGERDARKYALRKVRDTVDDLHKKWFRSIKADEMVPCCCSKCSISDNPELYKLEKLLKRRLNRPDTSCDISGEDLMIQQLLEGVYDKKEISEMNDQTY